jgi:hypothetical protein
MLLFVRRTDRHMILHFRLLSLYGPAIVVNAHGSRHSAERSGQVFAQAAKVYRHQLPMLQSRASSPRRARPLTRPLRIRTPRLARRTISCFWRGWLVEGPCCTWSRTVNRSCGCLSAAVWVAWSVTNLSLSAAGRAVAEGIGALCVQPRSAHCQPVRACAEPSAEGNASSRPKWHHRPLLAAGIRSTRRSTAAWPAVPGAGPGGPWPAVPGAVPGGPSPSG